MRISACARAIVAAAGFIVVHPSTAQQSPSLDSVADALRSGQAAEAVTLADRAIEASPRDPRPWTMKGIALATLGRHEESVRAFDGALAIDANYLPALQGAAQIELRKGLPGARQRLERIVRIQPGNITAHAMLGVVAYAARDCDRALEHFAKGEPAVAADPAVLRQRAECQFMSGHFHAAAADYRRLIQQNGATSDLRYNLGLSLHEAERSKEAVDVLRAAVDAETTPEIEMLSLLADAQHAAMDPPGAIATLQQAIHRHPRSERLYLQLAEMCIEHGAYDLGIEIVEVGRKNIPGSHRIPTMRGILLAELGRYDEAEAAFQTAADTDPDAQEAAYGLSMTLQKTGRMDESLEVLRKRVEQSPDDAVAMYFFAQARIRQGVEPGTAEFERVLDGLAMAVQKLPREVSPRVELGKLYLRAKDPERAIDVLEEAAALDPDNRQATYNLMIALRRVGRSDEATALAARMRNQLNQSKEEEVRRNRYRLVRTDSGEPE